MTSLSMLLSAAMPLALLFGLWMLAQISRRFGEVTHRPPLYRGFYLAMVLLVLPLGVRLLAIGLTDDEIKDLGGGSSNAMLHDVPLALSVTVAVVIAWRYWGWLVYAREGLDPAAGGK
ncbi:MAG: hypothetical protein JXQ72_12545 [Anaerolineae bacterium]|nr:hypothetical protein [Anaerolineae bacterium]